jgi:hypothetical protein
MNFGYWILYILNDKWRHRANYSAILLSITLLLLLAQSANAIDLGMPISCNYGKDCFISNYFDHDAAKNSYKDRTCGNMSKDGYKSTDFILKNTQQMKDGVNVVASDEGIVKAVRNNIADLNVELSGEEAVSGHECGNGVVIEHKRGYETQYCHLKKSSINVKLGDKVAKGQKIAEVGLSGFTSFPYLEFTVRMNGTALDPFTGEDQVTGKAEIACDNTDIYSLWDKKTEKTLIYINSAVLSIGFSAKVPNAEGAREGRYNNATIPDDAKLLSFWIDILGVMKGDKLQMSIISPDGDEIYSNTKSFSADKRHVFQFSGKKLDSEKTTWKNGEYIGKAVLLRDGDSKVIDARTIATVSNNAPLKD